MDLFTLMASVTLDTKDYVKSVNSVLTDFKKIDTTVKSSNTWQNYEKVADSSFESINKIVKSVNDTIENQGDTVSAVSKTVKNSVDIISNNFNQLQNTATGIFEPVTRGVDSVKSGFLNLGNTATSLISKLTVPFKSTSQEINSLDSQVKSLKTWEDYARDSNQSFDEIKKEVKQLSDTFEREGNSQKDALEKAYDTIGIVSEKEMKKATDNVDDEFDKMDKRADSFSSNLKSTFSKGLGILATGTTVAVGAVSTAISALGVIGFNYNKQIETYTTNFEVMLGDTALAIEKVEQLKEMGAKTPFELPELASATEQLLAFGVANEDTQGYLQQLGDISLGNVDKLNTLVNAFGKMNSSGKVTLETINMMSEQGFNPLQEISRTTGESMTSLYDRVSAGAVSLDEITGAFESATSAGGQFEGGMDKASKTTEGLISTLKDNAQALVGEVFEPISAGILQQLLPSAITGIDKLAEAYRVNGINGLIQVGGELLGAVITGFTEMLPKITTIALDFIVSLTNALIQNAPQIATAAGTILTSLVNGITQMLPLLLQLAFDLIINFANYLSQNATQLINSAIVLINQLSLFLLQNLPTLILTAIQLITAIVTALSDNAEMFSETGAMLITTLAFALIQATPQLIQAGVQLMLALFRHFIVSMSMFIRVGIDVVQAIISGLSGTIGALTSWAGNAIQQLFYAFLNQVGQFVSIGKAIVDGILQGVTGGWSWLTDKVSGLVNGLVGGVKGALGIQSPSKVFAEIGGYTAEGLGVGFEDKFKDVQKSITNSLDFSNSTGNIPLNSTNSGANGNISKSPVSVIQNIYSEAKTASDLMQEALYQQKKAVLLA